MSDDISRKMSGLGVNKDDFTCPICMYIMIHPVTMPCKHSLCMMCYKQCVEKASLACPICRLRISVWARKNARSNTLIDRVMWETIQKQFPVEVRNYIEGKDESTDDNWDSPSAIEAKLRKFKELSEPGEIRQEYEAAIARLDRQREEEARKEEEASAALIRALQEEEEEELAKLARERDEHERLGRQTAEQIFQETCAARHERRLRDASKTNSNDSKKRCESASMKLDSFYNSYRKSSNSAPPRSELATTISNNQGKNEARCKSKTDNYSPYPYSCISPSDKVPSSLPSEAAVEEVDETPHCLMEHSYTTASAERIDLTLPDESTEWATLFREDVQRYIKTEPPDIEDPLLETQHTHVSSSTSFQPICSSLKTPPKKLPSGEIVDPALIRSVPRSLTFGFGGNERNVDSSLSDSNCSSEIFPDQDSEFRTLGGVYQNDSNGQEDGPSVLSSILRCSNSVKRENEYLEKMKLTRKIVYGSSKHKKHGPAVSSVCSSLPCTEVHTLPLLPSTSAMKNNGILVDTSCDNATVTRAATSSNIEQNISDGDENRHDGDNCRDKIDDYFMPGDSRLQIPLESEVEGCFSYKSSGDVDKNKCREDLMMKKYQWRPVGQREILELKNCNSSDNMIRKRPSGKAMVSKKVSKSVDGPSNTSSIRDWCSTNKRKTTDSVQQSQNGIDTPPARNLTTEEADHLYALELQKLFAKQDKIKARVDRFQGSSNEYSFRKKRRLN